MKVAVVVFMSKSQWGSKELVAYDDEKQQRNLKANWPGWTRIRTKIRNALFI